MEAAVNSMEGMLTGQTTTGIIEQVMWQGGIPKAILNKQLPYLESPGNKHQNLTILISFLTVISRLHWKPRVDLKQIRPSHTYNPLILAVDNPIPAGYYIDLVSSDDL